MASALAMSERAARGYWQHTSWKICISGVALLAGAVVYRRQGAPLSTVGLVSTANSVKIVRQLDIY